MIEVDLLPGGRRGRPRRRKAPSLNGWILDRWILGSVLVLVSFFGFAAYFLFSVRSRASRLEEAVEAALRDSVRYAGVITKINELEARRDAISGRVAIIRGLDARRYVWPRILDEVAAALPGEVWLTQVAELGAEGPLRFRVEGNAWSNFALTRFWNGLESAPHIRNVRLVSTEHAVVASGGQDRDIYFFVLEAGHEREAGHETSRIGGPETVTLSGLGAPGSRRDLLEKQ